MSCLRTKWGIPLIVIVCVTLVLMISRRINYGRYYGRSRFRMSSRPPSVGSCGRTFLYFAYGSNLLTERIHFQNPSATFIDAAKLDGYKLEFRLPSKVNISTVGSWNECSVDSSKFGIMNPDSFYYSLKGGIVN